MKSAKIFLAGMYIHLLLSILIPGLAIVLAAFFWTDTLAILFDFLILFYLLMIGIVHILGWISAGFAVCAYQAGEYEKLRRGWTVLKIWSVPFYILNFLYSFIVWGTLVGASRGILVILVPIPIFITCSMVVQSGFHGICYVMFLRKRPAIHKRPSEVHYAFQLVPMLDILSTIILLRKYPAADILS